MSRQRVESSVRGGEEAGFIRLSNEVSQPAPGRPRILLAEDHDDTREALALLLEMHGYEVILARDGHEALTLAIAGHPDIVLTDYDMPGLDGAGLARKLRELSGQFSRLPILVLTALNQRMIEPALEAGANAYIPKPIDFQMLEMALASYVSR